MTNNYPLVPIAQPSSSQALVTACGQVLNIPAPSPAYAPLRFPSIKPAPVKPGYQEAHQYYCEMRDSFASKAYISVSNAELIVVKMRLMTHPPAKRNPICVSVRMNPYGFVSWFLFFHALEHLWSSHRNIYYLSPCTILVRIIMILQLLGNALVPKPKSEVGPNPWFNNIFWGWRSDVVSLSNCRM